MITGGMSVDRLNTSTAVPKFTLGRLRPAPSSTTVHVPHSHTFASSPLRQSVPPPQVDMTNWNATVSELHTSIRQMKDDLVRVQRSQQKLKAGGPKLSVRDSDDDLDFSEQSLLSRSDLSPLSSQHSTLVHS